MIHWHVIFTDHTGCGRQLADPDVRTTKEIGMITCSSCLAWARLGEEEKPGLTTAEQGVPA
jgi:hypothetical protein